MVRSSTPKLTSGDVIKLLAVKHSDDVFVTECKDGPTQWGSHRRMDAWVMNRSWSRACVTGYEVKVSRRDFLGDKKWPDYLDLCNELYFVCPHGLITVEECPPDAGLMWVAKTGTRIYTKKKAPYRQVTIPESVWRYILMCRVRVRDELAEPVDKAERWRQWLERKKENRELGYNVSRAIRDHIDEMQRKVNRADEKVRAYEKVRALLEEMGIDPDKLSEYSVEHRVREAITGVHPRLVFHIREAADRLEKILGLLDPKRAKAE